LREKEKGMKIAERKRAEPKKSPESEREQLFEALVSGKDIIEEIETKRGVFAVKYLTFADIIAKSSLVSARVSNRPLSSINAEAQQLLEITSYLDVAVVDYPEWFKKAREANPDFSFADIPDDSLLYDLYNRGCSFRDSMREKLAGGKGGGENAGQAPAPAPEKAVGGGAFEGLSGSAGI
jgi:hypothetical protein